jgi:drug/metabolite transporter (DMT)-like permease
MKKDILDLRFIIGLFFTLVGLALMVVSFVMTTSEGKSEVTNFWSGIFYIAFGIIMIILWYTGENEEKHE